MKKKYIVILFCLVLHHVWAQQPASRICNSCSAGSMLPIICPLVSTALYVDASKSGSSGDGKSWSTAKKTLQEALEIANSCSMITAIHVAEGVYKPSTTGNRDHNFFIGNSYSIYGGYPKGGGTRNPAVHPTILDGNIGSASISTDNSYHVVVIAGVSGNVTLQGLQIRNGYAKGSGVQNLYGSVSIDRSDASGLYINDVSGNVTLKNCAISGNVANRYGGGIYIKNSTLNMYQCIVYENASTFGKAIFNASASISFKSGIIYNIDGSKMIYGNGGMETENSIVWGEGAPFSEYGINPNGMSPEVMELLGPRLSNPLDGDGPDNTWFTADDGLRLKSCSRAINRGNNAAVEALGKDVTGNPRIYDQTVDIGPYEYQEEPVPSSANMIADHGQELYTHSYGGYTTIVSACKFIAKILPSGAQPLIGRVTGKAFVETAEVKYKSTYLTRRHYDIDPDVLNTATSTGTVTLYFKQEDFNNYNTTVGRNANKLPQNSTDLANKSKLRIVQFHGHSIGETGMPDSYTDTGHVTIIDPEDANIKWHNARNFEPGFWSITFDVTGFGGFYVIAEGNLPSTRQTSNAPTIAQLQAQESNKWVSRIINPIHNTLTFSIQSEKTESLFIKVMDIHGRVVMKNNLPLNQGINNVQLPAAQLAKGIYLMELVQDGKRVVKKLVKD